MTHKPTTPLRITSGALAGTNVITSKNTDGSVTVKAKDGSTIDLTVPTLTKGTFAVGSGPLPSGDDPVIIGSSTE